MNAPSSNLLKSRIILITGAAGGLGAVAAIACAEAGAGVILLDKRVKPLEKLHDDILALGHAQPAIYPLDLETAAEADFAELAEIIDGQFGVLHGLLHSAADIGIFGPLADVNANQWDRVLRVNLSAAHRLTRALLPLLEQGGQRVGRVHQQLFRPLGQGLLGGLRRGGYCLGGHGAHVGG